MQAVPAGFLREDILSIVFKPTEHAVCCMQTECMRDTTVAWHAPAATGSTVEAFLQALQGMKCFMKRHKYAVHGDCNNRIIRQPTSWGMGGMLAGGQQHCLGDPAVPSVSAAAAAD